MIAQRYAAACTRFVEALQGSDDVADRECAHSILLARAKMTRVLEMTTPTADMVPQDKVSTVQVVTGLASTTFVAACVQHINECMRLASGNDEFDLAVPHTINPTLHSTFGSSIAWSSTTKELFGVASGWWLCRVAAAVHHPRIRQLTGAHSQVALLPTPAYIVDVPELRKLGLATTYRTLTSQATTGGAGGTVSPRFMFVVQGGHFRWTSPGEQASALTFAPDGSLILVPERVHVQFVSAPDRIPKALGWLTSPEQAAIDAIYAGGHVTAEYRKLVLQPKSSFRKAFGACLASGRADQALPMVVLPVTLGPATLVHHLSGGETVVESRTGTLQIVPRAREFESGTRTEKLSRIDEFVDALRAVGLG
jgi:hypothetical protein